MVRNSRTGRGVLRSVLTVIAILAAFVPLAQPRQAGAATPNDQVTVPVQGQLTNLSTSPYTLSPRFDPSITDYVLYCRSGINDVQLSMTGASPSSTTVPLGENQAVVVQTASQQYWIRCLPHDFPRLSTTVGPAYGSLSPGWYLTGNFTGANDGSSSGYTMVLDTHGTPVWYQKGLGIGTTVLGSSTLAWGGVPGAPWTAYDLSTQTTTNILAPSNPPSFPGSVGPAYTDQHEFQVAPNGNYVMLTQRLQQNVPNLPSNLSAANGQVIDCLVEEFTPQGQLTWSWDAYNDGGIGPDELGSPNLASTTSFGGTTAADLYHCNSVEYSADSSQVAVSIRSMSSVYDIDHASKHVTWRLSGRGETHVPSGAALIKPQVTPGAGVDPEGGFSGQHDARFHTSNTQLALYDDHSQPFPGSSGQAARGAVYALPPTIAPGQSYDAPLVKQVPLYQAQNTTSSIATGSFRAYGGTDIADDTDFLVGWGFANNSGFTDFDANGNVELSQTFPNGEKNYRATKVAPGALDLNLMRATAGLPRQPYPSPLQYSRVPAGTLTSKPAATAWSAARQDVFGRGTDGQLWHASTQNGAWTSWESLGGQIASGSGPAAAAWSSGRIDIFVRGLDNQLWHRWWDGTTGWGPWQVLGGALSSGPTASTWGPNRLDVSVAGTDHQVYHLLWDGARWSGWELLGGQTNTDPGSTSWAPGRYDLFVQGTDGQLWHKDWDASVGAWSGWQQDGGNIATGPAAASIAPNELDVAAIGSGWMPERLEFGSGSWQLWQPLGGWSDQIPALVAPGGSGELAFVTGGDGGVWYGALPGGVTPDTSQKPPTVAGLGSNARI